MREITIAALALFFIISIIAIISFAKRKNRLYLNSTITALVFYAALFTAVLLGVYIPYFVLCLTLLSLFIHVFFGYRLDFYSKSAKFDRYLHAFGTFCFSLLFYFLLGNFIAYGGSRLFRAFYIAFLGTALGAVYEIFEFVLDIKKNANLQKDLKDTNMDIVFNIIGSVSAAVFAYFTVLK
jgi:hypothetical protein